MNCAFKKARDKHWPLSDLSSVCSTINTLHEPQLPLKHVWLNIQQTLDEEGLIYLSPMCYYFIVSSSLFS